VHASTKSRSLSILATAKTYTINAYLTKCSLLINGENVEKFIDDDIKEIHSIMSQTKINGVKIDVRLLNQAYCQSF
jgi:hypothetical protein